MLSVHSASKRGWQDLSCAAKRVSMSPHKGTVTIDLLRVVSDVTGSDVAHEWSTQPVQLRKICYSTLIVTVCKLWYVYVVCVCREVHTVR